MVNKKDINKILQEMKIPGPDESVKKAAIKASVSEFNRQKESLRKNLKGNESEWRLIGRIQIFLNLLGGYAMKRSFVIAGGVTAVVAILVVSLTYKSIELNEVSQTVNVPTVPAGTEEEFIKVEGPLVVKESVSPQKGCRCCLTCCL